MRRDDRPLRATPGTLAAAILTVTLSGLVASSVLTLPGEPPGLTARFQDSGARQQLVAAGGVENPVTGVLLNFRAYDTLLELAVLVLAAMGVQAVWRQGWFAAAPAAPPPLLAALAATVAPVVVLVAGYMLWIGADRPGGAFQAGAAVGGAGVLLLLAGVPVASWLRGFRLHFALVLGLATFAAVGLGMIVGGRHFLQYPPGAAKAWILLIETTAMLSVGAIFIALLAGVLSGRSGRQQPQDFGKGGDADDNR